MANINYYAGINMVGSDIDFNKNEAVAIVIDNQATAPSSPVEGQMYFDTTAGDKTMYFYNGSAWVEMDGSGSGVSQLTAGSGISLSGATGNVTITNSGVLSVNTTDGTFVDLTPNSATTGAVTVTADLSASGSPSATTFLRGDNVWATPAGAYTSWSLEADSGSAVDITDGLRVDFTGGTGISTAVASATPNTLTITNTGVTSVVAGSNISISGSTGAVTISSTDTNTTSLPVKNSGGTTQFTSTQTTGVRFAGSGGTSVAFDSGTQKVTISSTANTNTTYTLPTTNGSNPDIVLTGSDGSTDIVNIEGTSGTVKVAGSGTNTLTFNLEDDVSIVGDLTVGGGDIVLSGTGRIQGIDTVSASTDAASKGYVDGLVTGGLTFKGTFRVDTGAILSGSNSGSNLYNCPGGAGTRVAVAVGDYYLVATAGGSFFCSGSTLDVGDSVIGVSAASANASVASDFSLVQSDEGVVSLATATGTSSGAPITLNGPTGAVTITSRSYNGGNNVGYVPSGGSATTFLRGDGTWVTPTNTNTTYTMDFTQSSDDVDMKLDASSGTDTTMKFVAGSNITLTRNSATQMTITATDTNTNNYVDSLSWNSGNGVLTVGRLGLSDLTVDLDGRYLTGNETITLTGDVGGTGTTSITTTIQSAAVEASMLNNNVISGQTALTSTPAGTDELLISDAGTIKRVDVALLADIIHKQNTFAATLTSYGAVTHNLGTYDVIVQLYDASNYETIKAGVDRTSTNAVTISGNSFPANNIRVLISAIQS